MAESDIGGPPRADPIPCWGRCCATPTAWSACSAAGHGRGLRARHSACGDYCTTVVKRHDFYSGLKQVELHDNQQTTQDLVVDHIAWARQDRSIKELQRSVQQQETVANVMFGVAGALAVTAAVLYFLELPLRGGTRREALLPGGLRLSPTVSGLHLSGAF